MKHAALAASAIALLTLAFVPALAQVARPGSGDHARLLSVRVGQGGGGHEPAHKKCGDQKFCDSIITMGGIGCSYCENGASSVRQCDKPSTVDECVENQGGCGPKWDCYLDPQGGCDLQNCLFPLGSCTDRFCN